MRIGFVNHQSQIWCLWESQQQTQVNNASQYPLRTDNPLEQYQDSTDNDHNSVASRSKSKTNKNNCELSQMSLHMRTVHGNHKNAVSIMIDFVTFELALLTMAAFAEDTNCLRPFSVHDTSKVFVYINVSTVHDFLLIQCETCTLPCCLQWPI